MNRFLKGLMNAVYNALGSVVGIAFLCVMAGGWLTHAVVCIINQTWGLLIAGAIFFQSASYKALAFGQVHGRLAGAAIHAESRKSCGGLCVHDQV